VKQHWKRPHGDLVADGRITLNSFLLIKEKWYEDDYTDSDRHYL
jgi:hypothetical protein